MRGTLVVVAATLIAASVAAQQPTFRSGVDTVAIYATVLDASGRLVPDLEKADFELLVDGRPTSIAVFSKDPQPLSVAIMIDTSSDMAAFGPPVFIERSTKPLRDSIVAFGAALNDADRVSVGTFSHEIAVGANLTNDRTEIARVLDEEMWGGGGTPLWQAISGAMTSLSREPGRRVVLLFTNGRDTGSLPGWRGSRRTVEAQAVRENVMIYAIKPGAPAERNERRSMGNTHLFLSDDLESLSEATGGGHFNMVMTADATVTMKQVAEELRHQYLIGFVPTAFDGATHSLSVRASRPGVKVRARTSYVATR